MEVHKKLGRLPRRFAIQADNTVKETKNTIAVLFACYLLAMLPDTDLDVIEFLYFMGAGSTYST